ncbi:MAG TPA: acyl-ACP--UDP-N-acetylglucosamine O-acyltransferase [Myxococcota bacterium]
MRRVHPTAIVDPGAKLAEDVEIGPYSVIGGNVELAPEVVIGSHVTLMGRTRIGARSRISPFAVIGGEPQVLGASGENTALEIGEDNVIREFSSIHVGSPNGGGCTRIGNGNFILNNVHIAHDCRIGDRCVLASFSALAGHVVLEDHVVFGAMTGVHQFVRIGESAFTAANSMVSKDAVPFSKVAGDRARFAGLNTVGLRRRGFSDASVATLKHAFHILFSSKLRLETAADLVKRECGDAPEVAHLLRFIHESERGFIR